MQYSHWLMVTGGVVVAVELLGFVFQKINEPAKEHSIGPRSHLKSLPIGRLP